MQCCSLPLYYAAGRVMDPRLVLAEESNKRLATTLQHYRNWAGQLLARYQMANPDASRPPRRIYVGGLPAGTTEVSPSLIFHLFNKTFIKFCVLHLFQRQLSLLIAL